MDGLAHRLATGNCGITQDHYAAIQMRIAEHIKELEIELKYNKKWYVSCTKCNMIFSKEILIDGVCRKCTYPIKKENQNG